MVSSKHKKTEESLTKKRDRRQKESHACGSSSFTSSVRTPLSSPDNELEPGNIVCITSVKGNAGYNGYKGIILNAIFLNDEKKENLSQNYHVPRYQVRLIEGYPDKILYVKSSNVVREERDSRDWILKEKKMSVLEIIKSPKYSSLIGNAHACHDFALNLWAEVTRNRHNNTPLVCSGAA